MHKRRILVPIEFSENDRNGLRYAHALAGDLGWAVTIIHIFHPLESARELELPDKDYEKGMLMHLRSFAVETLEGTPSTMRFLAIKGKVADEIIAKSASHDLILLSSIHYRHIMSRWLGSRTSTIAAMGYCPVLIVPMTASYAPIQHAWTLGQKEANSLRAMSCVKSIGWETVRFEWKELPEHWLEKNFWTRLLKRWYQGTKPDLLAASIQTQLEKEAIDLIIVVNQYRDKLQKLMNDESKQLAFKYHIPVLVVPLEWEV